MKFWVGSTLLLAIAAPPAACAAAPLTPETVCASNPAYSASVMLGIVQEELTKDHDASLDQEAPDKLAAEAATQGISDCAMEMRSDQATYQSIAGLTGPDLFVGWDAYNTSCADRKGTKGACIHAEVAAARALKHMATTNQPPGSKALVQTCELVMKTNPAMSEWRECVDHALAVHAPEPVAVKCKMSVSWHTAKTGMEAGRAVADCLKSG